MPGRDPGLVADAGGRLDGGVEHHPEVDGAAGVGGGVGVPGGVGHRCLLGDHGCSVGGARI